MTGTALWASLSPAAVVSIVAALMLAGLAAVGLLARRYQAKLSCRYLITRLSAFGAFLAINFGVAIILVVLSIMGGYVERFRETLRGQEAHLLVLSERPYALTRISEVDDIVASVPNVTAAAAFIETLAMYRSGGFNPCQLRGVDVDRHVDVTDMGKSTLRASELDSVLGALGIDEERDDERTIEDVRKDRATAIQIADKILSDGERAPISSEEFAAFFHVESRRGTLARHNPEVAEEYRRSAPPHGVLVGLHFLVDREMFLGQVLTVVTLDPATSQAVSIPLVVVGAFKTGTFEYDSSLLYTNVDIVRNKLNLYDLEIGSSRYQGMRLAVADLDQLPETRAELQRRLIEYARADASNARLRVESWEDHNPNKINAVEREKYVIYFLLIFLVAFTACMILLMLVLTVIEKTRDIGILLALGATPRGIVGIFLINGVTLTFAGTISGLFLGYLFCENINPIHDWIDATFGVQLFPPEVYDLDRIPIAFRWEDVLLSAAPALVLGVAASLIPAVWASRRNPIETIQHE